MKMQIGYRALIEAAEREIETLDLATARKLLDDGDTVFVDLRDVRELTREGKVPGAFHAPRGMLEFWVDPESPYHKDVFATGKRLVFYCQSGWRSALATQAVQRMGLPRVCHVAGGFAAWKAAGAPVEAVNK
jgi:rhodanese-related sulfurtransferase